MNHFDGVLFLELDSCLFYELLLYGKKSLHGNPPILLETLFGISSSFKLKHMYMVFVNLQ